MLWGTREEWCTLSCRNVQSILISRKARRAATTDWKTLGIFFNATRRLVRGSVTALQNTPPHLETRSSCNAARTKSHQMHRNRSENLQSINQLSEPEISATGSYLQVHCHSLKKRPLLRRWTMRCSMMNRMACPSYLCNMDDESIVLVAVAAVYLWFHRWP